MERVQTSEEAAEDGVVARRGISAQVEDFLEQVEKFINNLMSARTNMEGQVELAENGVGPIIDTVKTPADYQDAGEGCCVAFLLSFIVILILFSISSSLAGYFVCLI